MCGNIVRVLADCYRRLVAGEGGVARPSRWCVARVLTGRATTLRNRSETSCKRSGSYSAYVGKGLPAYCLNT